MPMKTVLLALLLMIPSLVQAQDKPSHFFGTGQAVFRDAQNPGQYCTFNVDVEVKGPPEYTNLTRYKRAFSYTVRNLRPVTLADASCAYDTPTYVFQSLCRAFSMSDGSIGVDVPVLGIITVTPRTREVRAVFSANAQTGNFGFGVSTIYYRLSVLPDGGLEVFAYLF